MSREEEVSAKVAEKTMKIAKENALGPFVRGNKYWGIFQICTQCVRAVKLDRYILRRDIKEHIMMRYTLILNVKLTMRGSIWLKKMSKFEERSND